MTPSDKCRPSARPEKDSYWHRRIWALALPIMLSNVSTPLLGMVDTAVVGRLPSPHYLGAVAIGSVVFTSLFWLFGFLRMGTTGLTAQAVGAEDMVEATATLGRALIIGVLIGLFLIVTGGLAKTAALAFFQATPAVEDAAAVYIDIRIWAAPATLVNYALLGWFLGMQRAGLALSLQLILNITNIMLDILFVVGLGWTVDGVAVATVIAECLAAMAGLWIALRLVRGAGTQWSAVWRCMGDSRPFIRLVVVNRDIFLRTLCLVTATVWFTRTSARYGETALAANAILQQLHLFMAYGLDGFAQAAEALVGRTVGARRRQDFMAAVRVSTLWAGLMAVAFAVAYATLGPSIIALLTGLEDVRSAAATYLPWAVAMPLAAVWSFQLDGIFIGATWTRAMRNSMAFALIVFLLSTWVLTPLYGVHGLWASMMIFMAARAIALGGALPGLTRTIPLSADLAASRT